MPKVELVGGPHDGMALSSGLGAAFLFTDGKRCFRAPRRGRSLYRAIDQASVGLVAVEVRYRFVGHTHGLCECGAFRKRSRPCALCGSEVLVG